MSRYHWWGFIVNEAGEPIENAEITVTLAGEDELASLYYDEFGNTNSADNPALSAGPQLSTLSNGYYEFWIGDVTETHGYRNDTKFTIEWIRLGVAYGKIEYINIFPLGPQIDPVSLTGCESGFISTETNKTISDYLACKWDNHADSVIVNSEGDFVPIHGLNFISVDDFNVASELDEVQNKIIDNYHAWHWDNHRISTVQTPAPSAGNLPWDGRPHNLDEVNPVDGSDTLRNKLVSNCDLYNIHTKIYNLKEYSNGRDDNLQYQIDQLSWTTDQSKSGWWEIFDGDWTLLQYDTWYVDVTHNLDIYYPLVQVYEKDTGKTIQSTEIQYVSVNTIRVVIHNELTPDPPDKNLIVRIANGGVHRHP